MNDLEILAAELRNEANFLLMSGHPTHTLLANSFDRLADRVEARSADRAAKLADVIQQDFAGHFDG